MLDQFCQTPSLPHSTTRVLYVLLSLLLLAVDILPFVWPSESIIIETLKNSFIVIFILSIYYVDVDQFYALYHPQHFDILSFAMNSQFSLSKQPFALISEPRYFDLFNQKISFLIPATTVNNNNKPKEMKIKFWRNLRKSFLLFSHFPLHFKAKFALFS